MLSQLNLTLQCRQYQVKISTHSNKTQESKEPPQKGAVSNHVISSINYQKFLSSYWHSPAEQCYTPARVLTAASWEQPVRQQLLFCIESVPWSRSCSQDQINPSPDRAEAAYHHLPTANNCRDKYLPWLSAPDSRLPLGFRHLWTHGLKLNLQELYPVATPHRSKVYHTLFVVNIMDTKYCHLLKTFRLPLLEPKQTQTQTDLMQLKLQESTLI